MSDILSRLQQQASDFSNVASRGEEIIQGFDTDKLMAQGQQYAYNMGKAQLETLIGSEAVTGLTHGVPVVYKTGKAVAQRLQGMPTTREEAIERAKKMAQQKLNQPTDDDEVTTETPTGAPPDTEARNFRYNPAEGTITSETGEPVEFGEARFSQLRTPLEQEAFENPAGPSGPVGTVPDRPEYEDIDLGTRGANVRANVRFRQEAEASQAEPEPQPQAPEPTSELPDIPGIGTGQTIGTQPVAGEFTGQASTYTRPGTQLRIDPEISRQARFQPQSRVADETPRDPVGRLTDITEKYEAEDIGEPLEFETREVAGSEVVPFQAGERFSGVGLARGQTSFVPPPPGEAPTLSQPSTSLQLPQVEPQDQALLDRAANLRLPDAPTTEPEGLSRAGPALDDLFPAPPTTTTLQPGVYNTATGQIEPAQVQPFDDMQARLNALKSSPEAAEAAQKPEGGPPITDDEFGKARLDNLRSGGTEEAEDAVDQTLARTGAEEAIADAIPGVGEILGAGLALFGGIEAAVEASKEPKAPQQAPGQPALQTAYDSAPVIDSSSYHNI